MDTLDNLPVIAAIPNYNMGASLAELLPQVLQQGYDAVYVLDDCSTDNSRGIVAQFSPGVTWIGGKRNLKAGGNRNRVLKAHKTECIIHFLDADVRLETNGTPAQARLMMRDPRTGFVGGLVKDAKGNPSIWNYGPDSVALYTLLTATIQLCFGSIQAPRPLGHNVIRILTKRARSEWPDSATPAGRRAVYWPVEGNLLVRRSVLEKLGGFDGSIGEYDIIPPARKAYHAGLVSYFDPSIVVKHLEINVRHYNRSLALYKELYILIRRYGGWRKWILPEGRFKPRYNQ
ncbi:MAG TPA: glycosyltransferase [Verrucomicrobiae bacterium]|nr:glycosyltransferase [Verrucomicrobiae bacterium]